VESPLAHGKGENIGCARLATVGCIQAGHGGVIHEDDATFQPRVSQVRQDLLPQPS
jgi:hypothetical protein